MNTIHTVAELRAELPSPAAPAADRARPDDGRVPRGPPVADAPRAPGLRPRRGVAVREPDPVQRPDRPGRVPARLERDADARRRARRRLPVRAFVEEVYPPGFATTVSVAGVTETLEGAHRGRAHFDGVATVVTKLFNMVGPDVAYFGQKDAQQALVIKRLVRDLDIPVAIEVCPTVREADGLAMSSRNVHLSPADRARAAALHRALARRGRRCQRRRARPERRARTCAVRAAARRDRARVHRARLGRQIGAGRSDRRRRARGPGRPARRHATDRQSTDPDTQRAREALTHATHDPEHRPRGGDSPRSANRRVRS